MDFLTALMQAESNGQNVYSKVDPDLAGPNSRSQGYYQITTPTWQTYGSKAGINLDQYPNAMSAPQEIQARVAMEIPFNQFGKRTRDMLHNQFGDFSNSSTVGALNTQFGGSSTTPGTTLNTNPVQTASNASAPTQTPAQSPFQQMQSGNILGGLTSLAKSPGIGDALNKVKPQGDQSAPTPMAPPNIQAHIPAPNPMMQLMHGRTLQGVPTTNIGGLGGMGGMNPQMMLQAGIDPYTGMSYG